MSQSSHSDAGLTLVEMLVVLAIVGVMAGVATLGVGSAGRRLGAEAEAHRLADDLQRAADETLVSGRALALTLAPSSYGVVEQDAASGWKPLEPPRSLAAGLSLTSNSEAEPQLLLADGMSPPFDAVLSDGRRAFRVSFDGLKATVAPEAV